MGEGVGLGVGPGVGEGVGEGVGPGVGEGKGVGEGVGEGVGLGVSTGVGEGVGEGVGLGVGTGVVEGVGDTEAGAYVGEGVGVKLSTTGDDPAGVGLADLWRIVVGSALGLTNGRTVGLATSCVGATGEICSASAPVKCSRNRKNPITKSAPNPLSVQMNQSSGNLVCIAHLLPEKIDA